jgi:2-polyprenyl-3-methyl-5-hydroxy-6-metoxy-1,4-benzoquinol methylase
VEGVDISEFASQYARERLGLPVRTSQFTTARYPEETFNVITMLDFLEHVPDPYQVLKKAWRIMKPGGTLVVLTPEHNSLGNKILALSYKIGFSLPLNYFYRVHHNYYFTQKNLQFILNKIGFKITLIEQRSENIDAFRCSWILKLPLKLLSSLARLLKMEDRVLVYARK